MSVLLLSETTAQTVVSADSSLQVSATADTNTTDKDSIIMQVPYYIPDSILSAADTVSATVEWQGSPPSAFAAQQAGTIIPNPARKRPQWLFAVFVAQLLMLIYVKGTGFKNLEDSLKAYFNINLSQQLFREQENSISFSVLLQIINFFISCTVMLFLLLDYFFQPVITDSFKIASVIFVLTLLIYLFKYSSYKALALVFPFSEEIDLFRFNYFLNQKLLGIALIPFVYAAAYSPYPYGSYFLLASVILFVAAVAVRSIKGLIIGAAMLRTHTFHFLLYICTLEIAPVLILVKWLQITGYGQN